MRLGLLSDIHANLPALEAALDALSDADEIVCAGDLVGYGPQPNEVVARLREAGIPSVAGNHDRVAMGLDDFERCDELARTTLEWTRTAIDSLTLARLAQLPDELDVGDDVLVAHGAPGDAWRYVREPDEARALLEALPDDVRTLVLGHTHEPLLVETDDGRRVVNPGSVGQSRERRPIGRVALLTDDGVEFRELHYDVDAVRVALRAAGLPSEAVHRRPPGALRRMVSVTRRT
jgi:predicted phosphodiesterase